MKTIYEEFGDDSERNSKHWNPSDNNNNSSSSSSRNIGEKYPVELNHNVAGGEQQPRQNTMLQNKTEKEAAASTTTQPGQSPKLANVSLVTLRDPAKVRASLYTPNRKR
jgi:hypothetical protein